MRSNALGVLRSLVLARCRLPPHQSVVRLCGGRCWRAVASLSQRSRSQRSQMQVVARALSTAAYLDKPAVTDRVLEVVKKFQKVEPSKVG
jgi:hypothetical protein